MPGDRFGGNAAPKLAYSLEPFCRQEPVCPIVLLKKQTLLLL
jgi:hypothetical protein